MACMSIMPAKTETTTTAKRNILSFVFVISSLILGFRRCRTNADLKILHINQHYTAICLSEITLFLF